MRRWPTTTATLLPLALLLLGCGPEAATYRAGPVGKGDGAATCRLVKGSFGLSYQGPHGHVGSQPDGDSMWFLPDRRELLEALGSRLKVNQGGFTQLRFRSIDALELHYSGTHQHLGLAIAARDAALQLAGFQSVVFAPGAGIAVRSSVPASTRGHVLVTGLDRYGRPLVYVFAGEASEPDGVDLPCDPERIAGSINAELLRQGLVYPAFYTDVADGVRQRLAIDAAGARVAGRGLWTLDRSLGGFDAADSEALAGEVVLPVLFRRLQSYYKDRDRVGASSFLQWLKSSGHDMSLTVVPEGTAVQASGVSAHLSEVVDATIEQQAGRSLPSEVVRLQRVPEQILFHP